MKCQIQQINNATKLTRLCILYNSIEWFTLNVSIDMIHSLDTSQLIWPFWSSGYRTLSTSGFTVLDSVCFIVFRWPPGLKPVLYDLCLSRICHCTSYCPYSRCWLCFCDRSSYHTFGHRSYCTFDTVFEVASFLQNRMCMCAFCQGNNMYMNGYKHKLGSISFCQICIWTWIVIRSSAALMKVTVFTFIEITWISSVNRRQKAILLSMIKNDRVPRNSFVNCVVQKLGWWCQCWLRCWQLRAVGTTALKRQSAWMSYDMSLKSNKCTLSGLGRNKNHINYRWPALDWPSVTPDGWRGEFLNNVL